MKCWICYNNINDYILFPETEDKYILPKNKETYEIKIIEPFIFLYYIYCNICLNKYLNNHKKIFKTIKNREIGIN